MSSIPNAPATSWVCCLLLPPDPHTDLATPAVSPRLTMHGWAGVETSKAESGELASLRAHGPPSHVPGLASGAHLHQAPTRNPTVCLPILLLVAQPNWVSKRTRPFLPLDICTGCAPLPHVFSWPFSPSVSSPSPEAVWGGHITPTPRDAAFSHPHVGPCQVLRAGRAWAPGERKGGPSLRI